MTSRYIPIIMESDKELPFYLVQVGQHWDQEHVVRPNGYLYQWIQTVEGEGELRLEDKTYRIKEGMAILLYKGAAHEYYAVSPQWIVDWIVFDGHQVEAFLQQHVGMPASGVLHLSRPDWFTSITQTLLDMEHADIPLRGVQCSSIIYTLLTSMMQYTSKQPNNSATNLNARLKPLFHYIEQNIDKPLTLEEMAAVTDYTPQHLCTIFKKSTGIRIFQYINSVRIKRSKELLLQQPQMQVKEIAALAGFEDVNYFCSVFKKHEQLSPSQFRRMYH